MRARVTNMGKPITGHVDLVFPGKYIKAADLRGKDVTVIIHAIEWEQLVMVGGKKDTKPAITMRAASGRVLEKKWIVRKTVMKMIAAATGERQVENWPGKRVTMYPTMCKGEGGAMVECIRVRVRAAATQEEPPEEMTAPVEVKDFVAEVEGDGEGATT